jgi:hypothetical protein
MSAFPISLSPVKGGSVLVDPDSGREQKSGPGSVKGAYGRWSGGDNLDTFNARYKVATDKGPPHDEAMIEAARKTKTSDWAKAAGFNKIRITKSDGSPCAFTSVEVEFIK